MMPDAGFFEQIGQMAIKHLDQRTQGIDRLEPAVMAWPANSAWGDASFVYASTIIESAEYFTDDLEHSGVIPLIDPLAQMVIDSRSEAGVVRFLEITGPYPEAMKGSVPLWRKSYSSNRAVFLASAYMTNDGKVGLIFELAHTGKP